MVSKTRDPRSEESELKAEHEALQRAEPRAKIAIDSRNVWLTAPLLIAFIGLIGTGVGAVLQGYWNTVLERTKFESTLIQKALAAPSQKEAAQYLKFLLNAGLLAGLNEQAIALASEGDGEKLPIFLGAAIRDRVITVRQAKEVLTRLNFYTGPIDDKIDLPYRIALMNFQKEKKLDIDGLIGPKTVLALWEACPECPKLLQIDGPPGIRAQ